MKNPLVVSLPEIDSTNAEMHRRMSLVPDLPHGTTVVAEYQTAGRGQQGNRWESQAGMNLTFTLLLRPRYITAAQSFILSQLVSLSIVEVLSRYLPGTVIKWPNDIYYGDSKLAGILIENRLQGETLDSSIVGIGLNINQLSFSTSLPNPVSLSQIIEHSVDREELLSLLVETISRTVADYIPADEAAVADRYRASLYRGKGFYPYFDLLAREPIRAEIAGVDSSGTLSLRTESGEIRRYLFKEVQYCL
ncbi:MAG: biotin--[acetyl-CoA-carboxylase] ligase [Porphyromonadaceae bacterium]|nr:biotin--[acetyl-CoA-carboxylase] ligase [Porphyromonadaceae bacterium]